MPKKNIAESNPLVVIVQEDRWDAMGSPTLINRITIQMIHKMNGVSETVPPGVYYARFERVGLRPRLALQPLIVD